MSQRDADLYAALTQRIAGKLEAMPEYTFDFVRRYRRHVEQVGRCGPGGCGDVEFERFVDDTLALLQAQWDAVLRSTGRAADATTKGSGH